MQSFNVVPIFLGILGQQEKTPNDGLLLWKTFFKNEDEVQLNLSLYSILEGAELPLDEKCILLEHTQRKLTQFTSQ
ncbi:MAG: hypothetical protein ACR2H1_03915 [Limisphaerales bacterium]